MVGLKRVKTKNLTSLSASNCGAISWFKPSEEAGEAKVTDKIKVKIIRNFIAVLIIQEEGFW